MKIKVKGMKCIYTDIASKMIMGYDISLAISTFHNGRVLFEVSCSMWEVEHKGYFTEGSTTFQTLEEAVDLYNEYGTVKKSSKTV